MKYFDTIIVGGGASGMMCAAMLSSRTKSEILLIDRNDRLGKKLSATGNGQGNISNAAMNVSHYFTTETSKVENILRCFDEKDLAHYLASLGGLLKTDEQGRIYPASMQASSITDLFRFELGRKKNVTVQLSSFVKKATQQGDVFYIQTENQEYSCKNLVIAAGGKAAKHFGTDGYAYTLAQSFSHSITALLPALVQLKTPLDIIRGMKGIRVDCELSLYEAENFLKKVRGDIIFTDYGVSGNAVFKVSSFLTRNNHLILNFLPDISCSEFAKFLQKKLEHDPDIPAENLLCSIINNAVARSLLKYCGIKGSAPFPLQRLNDVVSAVCGFPLLVSGTLGFDYAQVTKGGIPTEEVNENLMSKFCRNLYFTGEILNVDGECGGYNLQWAFSSAARVATAIVTEV